MRQVGRVDCAPAQLKSSVASEADRKRIERETPQKVAAHSLFHLVQSSHRAFQPADIDAAGHAGEFRCHVHVADQVSGAGVHQQEILHQAGEGAQ